MRIILPGLLCMVIFSCGCSRRGTIDTSVETSLPTQLPMTEIFVPQTTHPSTETIVTATPISKSVTITGWFTIIWNGEPHYSITDEHGQTTRLLMDDEIAKPLGGPLALDRNLVTITGEIISESPRVVRVLSVDWAKSK